MTTDDPDTAAEAKSEESASKAFTLDAILNGNNEELEHPDFVDKAEGGWDEDIKETEVAQGFCIECEGTLNRLLCKSSGSLILLCNIRSTCGIALRNMRRRLLRRLFRCPTQKGFSEGAYHKAIEW